MKTIEQWEVYFRSVLKDKEHTEQTLKYTLEKIKFLEEIYQIGKEWHVFSEEFSDKAYQERQNLCLESSALYEILRKDYQVNKNHEKSKN